MLTTKTYRSIQDFRLRPVELMFVLERRLSDGRRLCLINSFLLKFYLMIFAVSIR